MTGKEPATENFWFHRCDECSHCFSAAELTKPCPKCGNRENRDTISHNFYLDERYGRMTPEEWSTTLAIEDLTNPVDTTDETEQPVSDPLYDRILVHVGHQIEAVKYGREGEQPANVAVECIDCRFVLVDADCCDG